MDYSDNAVAENSNFFEDVCNDPENLEARISMLAAVYCCIISKKCYNDTVCMDDEDTERYFRIKDIIRRFVDPSGQIFAR